MHTDTKKAIFSFFTQNIESYKYIQRVFDIDFFVILYYKTEV